MLQLVNPRAGPKGHHMNNMVEVHKEMLHTKYQSSRPSSFRVEELWNFRPLFLCSTFDPQGRASFDPRGISWTNLVEVHKEMPHTKYQISTPSSFREEEFWRWASLFLCSNLWPPGWGQFWLLVVLGFNATLTAKVISWRLMMHMCFLAFSHQY